MKQHPKFQLATLLTVIGLLLATVTPAILRNLPAPDYVRGFAMGVGIGLEIIGLVIFVRI